MKKHLFAFFLAFLAAQVGQAQDTTTVSFSLDTLRADSFFLQVTTTFIRQGEKRGRTQTEAFFFSDTLSFNGYIDALRQRLTDLAAQKAQISLEYESVSRQVMDIVILRDSVFRGVTGGFRSAFAPPFGAEVQHMKAEAQRSTGTTWVVFGATPKQIAKMNDVLSFEDSAVILRPDGTLVQFKKTKKRKRQ